MSRFVYTGGDLTVTNYTPGQDTIELASGYISKSVLTNSGKDVKYTIGDGSITVKDGAGKAISIRDNRGSFTASGTSITLGKDFGGTMSAAGYLGTVKNINGQNATKSLTINGNGNANDIFGGTGADKLNGGAGADRLFGGEGLDELSGGEGNDKLYGNAGNDKLSGGTGNDYLYGQAGNDTLTGGTGKDTFVYYTGHGNDTITDYTAGEDTVQLSSGYIGKSELSGADVKFTVGEGSVTVKNGSGKNIRIKDGRGSFTASGTTITLGSDFGGTMSAAGYLNTVKNIYGQSAAKALTINGNGNANDIFGGTRADKLNGGAGADRLFGGEGLDELSGGEGNDKLYGNAGNDKLSGGAGGDYLYGQEGNDTLTGGAGKDTFVHYQTYGNDTITDYTAGEDTVQLSSGYISKSELSGADVKFTVGEGSVTVKNGAGKNIRIKDSRGGFTASGTTITLGSDFGGTMSVAGYLSTVKNVYGQSATKSLAINGNGNANDIFGGTRADKLNGGAGADRLFGGEGLDELSGGEGNDKLYGNAGNDKLSGGAGDDYLYGQAGNDTLTGGTGKDTFVYYTGHGNDTITDYTAGDDTIQLSSGYIGKSELSGADVKFTVGEGSVTVKNGSGKNIRIKDGRGSFTASGTTITLGSDFSGKISAAGYLETVTKIDGRNAEGALSIIGNAKDNILYGSNSGTIFHGGAGNNTFYGGLGSDIFCFSETSTGYNTIHMYNQENGISKEDVIRLINNVSISRVNSKLNSDVVLTLNTGATIYVKNYVGNRIAVENDKCEEFVVMCGSSIADRLSGGNGNDKLFGEAGDDTIYGNAGNDIIYGGEDSDCIVGDYNIMYTPDEGDDTIHGGDGDDTIYGDSEIFYIEDDSSVDIEDLWKLGGNDVIYGGKGNDFIHAGGGNDTLFGGDGDDNLQSGYGNDTLYGEAGFDKLYGYDGNDLLSGGDDDDNLNGAYGDDILNGDDGDDYLEGGVGNDFLSGGDGDDTLRGDTGDDVLDGGLGDDYLTGGTGNDTFVYSISEGQDRINDYLSAEDKIEIKNGIISETLLIHDIGGMYKSLNDVKLNIKSISNDDEYSSSVIYVMDGSNLENTTGMTIQIKDNRGSYTASGESIVLGENFTGTIDANAHLGSVITIDGRASMKKIEILGNDNNNTIYGGKKESTLYGDGGNNTFYGGTGKDFFFFDESSKGNTIIYDYEFEKDVIQVSNCEILVNSEALGNDIFLYMIDGGIVNVKNAVKEDIKLLDANTGNYFTL